MTISLIKKEDCKSRRLNKPRYTSIEIEEQLDKPISLQLVDKEECSTSAKLTAEKMTKHKLLGVLHAKRTEYQKQIGTIG
jgi:hypothetical protein